jgi:hypothetical protein
MDLSGLKPFFGQQIVVATTISKEFVGTLEPIPNSQDAVSLVPLDAAIASNYQFAINGVASLSIGVVAFVQKLPAG